MDKSVVAYFFLAHPVCSSAVATEVEVANGGDRFIVGIRAQYA